MALPPFLVVPWARNVIGELIFVDLPLPQTNSKRPFQIGLLSPRPQEDFLIFCEFEGVFQEISATRSTQISSLFFIFKALTPEV